MESFSKQKIIMIMLDGVGIPPEGWLDSVYSKYCGIAFSELFAAHSQPLDACLGVEGIPQSATGQCALFTGVNAPQAIGRHIPGFPGPALRKIIRENNLFSSLLAKGKRPCFANAYVRMSLSELKSIGYRSVTTIMTESSLKDVLKLEDLQASRALYHDLTRESVADKFPVEKVSPARAAADLLSISRNYDLTLFEYFMTDRAGHKREEAMLKKYLGEISEFVCALVDGLSDGALLALTSDHGNCEDISTRMHTKNSVPLLLCGRHAPKADNVKALTDVSPWLVKLLDD